MSYKPNGKTRFINHANYATVRQSLTKFFYIIWNEENVFSYFLCGPLIALNILMLPISRSISVGVVVGTELGPVWVTCYKPWTTTGENKYFPAISEKLWCSDKTSILLTPTERWSFITLHTWPLSSTGHRSGSTTSKVLCNPSKLQVAF